MRVATGMLSVLALWSELTMAQSAALTLPREDGSSIHYYLDAAVPGQSSAALLCCCSTFSIASALLEGFRPG